MSYSKTSPPFFLSAREGVFWKKRPSFLSGRILLFALWDAGVRADEIYLPGHKFSFVGAQDQLFFTFWVVIWRLSVFTKFFLLGNRGGRRCGAVCKKNLLFLCAKFVGCDFRLLKHSAGR